MNAHAFYQIPTPPQRQEVRKLLSRFAALQMWTVILLSVTSTPIEATEALGPTFCLTCALTANEQAKMRCLREIVGKTIKTHSELGVCPHVFYTIILVANGITSGQLLPPHFIKCGGKWKR
jgi:hypothetical protein